MYCVHLYGLHVYCALVDLCSSGSPGVRPAPGLTSSTQVFCVCVRAYTSTHTPTTLTPAKIEKYSRQKLLSRLLPNHSLPRQQQALTMNKRKKPPLPIPPHTRIQMLRNTCDTRACSREIGQYKYTKCAYTSAYVHTHARVFQSKCIHVHRHTYIHMHTYTHAHVHAYMHTHIHTYAHAHVHAYMHIHIHVHACVGACGCMYVYMHICVCVVCMHIYLYTRACGCTYALV